MRTHALQGQTGSSPIVISMCHCVPCTVWQLSLSPGAAVWVRLHILGCTSASRGRSAAWPLKQSTMRVCTLLGHSAGTMTSRMAPLMGCSPVTTCIRAACDAGCTVLMLSPSG